MKIAPAEYASHVIMNSNIECDINVANGIDTHTERHQKHLKTLVIDCALRRIKPKTENGPSS